MIEQHWGWSAGYLIYLYYGYGNINKSINFSIKCNMKVNILFPVRMLEVTDINSDHLVFVKGHSSM